MDGWTRCGEVRRAPVSLARVLLDVEQAAGLRRVPALHARLRRALELARVGGGGETLRDAGPLPQLEPVRVAQREAEVARACGGTWWQDEHVLLRQAYDGAQPRGRGTYRRAVGCTLLFDWLARRLRPAPACTVAAAAPSESSRRSSHSARTKCPPCRPCCRPPRTRRAGSRSSRRTRAATRPPRPPPASPPPPRADRARPRPPAPPACRTYARAAKSVAFKGVC